jgi:hypothetical protein
MYALYTKFKMPSPDSSLGIVIAPKAKYIFMQLACCSSIAAHKKEQKLHIFSLLSKNETRLIKSPACPLITFELLV